jgi:hypothetical protein
MKGGVKVRKIFITSFLILLSVALISGSAYALSGVCSNCHTMHYSQNGTILSDWGKEGPYGNLLLATCVGCHTGDTPTAKNTHDAPIVYHTTAPSKTLAGGDFYWVKQGGKANDVFGHNVKDLGINPDGNIIGTNPPGWDPDATQNLSYGQINGGGADWLDQLKCAGKFGCHGNHTDTESDAAIKGSHHSNTGLTATRAVDATTVGASYRFLGGINGLENSEWNWNETASSHNEYYGVAGNPNYTFRTTISYSCAQCHGLFHSSLGTGTSPWLRHPTDIVLPDTAGKEYSAYKNYSVEAPVARPTVLSSSNSTVTPGTDIVMCLSCHRAHGSPEPDLLRWTYSGMVAGGGGPDRGCFTCHTSKN